MRVLSHRFARICICAFGHLICSHVVWPDGFVARMKAPSKPLTMRGCQAQSAEAWEELADELAKENDQERKKLLLRVLAAEMKTQAAEMKAQTQAAEMKAQTQAAEMKALEEKMKAVTKDLAAIKGELTARAMLERAVGKIRQEDSVSGSTSSILLGLSNHSGDMANFLNRSVQECTPPGTIPGVFLKDIFKQLSGQAHYPRWYGPGIRASRSLNAAQICVLQKLAQQEGFLLITDDDEDDSEDI